MKTCQALHTCTFTGVNGTIKEKTAFLQAVPQPSINTEPNSACARRRLLSIKVCKEADFGIYSFDRMCEGGLGFLCSALTVRVTLLTFVP